MTTHDSQSEGSDDAQPTDFNSEWDKLVLLMWKNIRVIWSNWEQFLMTILAPIFFCSILVVLRIPTNIGRQPVANYPILEFNDYWNRLMSLIDERKAKINETVSNPFIPEKIVGYAPNSFGYANIIKGASDDLGSLVVNSYETCDHLRSAIIQENLFAGVCFTTNTSTDVDEMIGGLYPNYLKYHLIFPFACRIYHDTFIGISWNTNSLYHFINRTDQRNIGQDDGGYVGYMREGFAPLQNAISMSYLKLVAALKSPDFQIPKVSMQRFPSKEFQKDDLIESVDFSMSLMIVLGNFYPVLMFIARIIEEKQYTLKSYSKLMGVGNYVHCLAWMCNYLLRALSSSLVIVVLLKIKWSSGISILEDSNFFVVLLIISIYNITSICFVLMLSPLFTQTIFAVYGTAFSWFFTYVPYIMSRNEGQGAFWGWNLFVVIFHNTTFGFVMECILDLEIYGEGLTLKNFFYTRSYHNGLSLVTLLCIMVMQSLLYICLSLYIEEIMPGDFGLAKRWNFLFTFKNIPVMPTEGRRVADSVSMGSGGSVGNRINRPTQAIFEVGGNSTKVLVKMDNVCKHYGDEDVLKRINLQLSDNEITIVLGQNGSGKTTLLKLMSGLSSITTGSINIEGFDVTHEARYACASLGLCMGSSLLYPDLTVEDQIRFFSYLKGFRGNTVELEVEHYLKATKLRDYRLEKTKYLSMGGLQKLAICCALVGKSRVVLLDDPTTHMDLPARTLIWKLLESEKLDRTILITSTSATILEGVGDRVAILANGELQCEGTPVFIRKMYGQGYRMIITRGPQCKVNDVTQKVREFIPNIIPLSSLGYEITYELDEVDSDRYKLLIDSLERNMPLLGIDSVTLRPLNLDDIFFKLAAANPSRENRARLMEIMNGESSYPEESKHLRFMEIEERVTGIRRMLQHFQAMWSQRILYAIYYKYLFISRLTFSPIFVVIAYFISSFNMNLKPMRAIDFSLDHYSSSVTLIERRNVYAVSYPILERYKELIFWVGVDHKMEDIEGAILSDYYLKKGANTMHRIDQDHHVGVTFAVNYIIAWFNNVALHSIPLSLNMVHNAILRAIYNDDCGIEITMEPLNNMHNYLDSVLRTPINTSHILPLSISLSVCCIWNTIVFIFVRNVRSGYDKAQIVAGIKFLTYWCVNISYDSLIIFLTSIFITLAIMACQYQLSVSWQIYVWYAFVFMLCGWCVYAFNYMLALFFVSASHAYTFSIAVQTFSVICFCHIIEAFEKHYVTTTKSPYAMYFMVLPLFSFCSAISTIYFNGDFQRICREEHIRFISINLENCQAIPNCCRKFTVFSFEDGILLEIMVMAVTTCICWWIILMFHFRYICNCSNIPEDDYYAQLNEHKRRHDDTMEYRSTNNMQFHEQYAIQKMTNAQLRKIPLICDRLGKSIDGKVVIDRISLLLDRFTSFGLLGMSGSGVTTFFNLIAGFQAYSYGRILIKGRSAIHNSNLVQKMIGYGRQEMINFPELTVQNVLEHACKLRSYPPQYVNEISVNLAKVLGLFSFYHKNLSVLSLGILNRLNCAVTVMGNPEIILLDMATVGIDTAGRREVWNVLNRMQGKGASLIISTTNFTDCQRYCSRVGFMAHGRLCRLGTPWQLCKLLPDSHILKVKLSGRMTGAGASASSKYIYSASVNKLRNFIQKEFPNTVLKEQIGNYFLFVISAQHNTISKIFTAMMRNANFLSIEDYELSQNLLSEVFSEFGQQECYLHEADVRYSRRSTIFL